MVSVNAATRAIASTLGVLVGIGSIEHGVLECLQGVRPTPGLIVNALGPGYSWTVWKQGGEGAFTLIPNQELDAGELACTKSERNPVLQFGIWQAKRTISNMIETLYKTDRPQKEKSECYVLVLTPRPASDGRRYSFMEEHGRWDDALSHFLHEVTQIVTEKEMSYDDARARYNIAKQNLSEHGFVHSFGPGCLPNGPKPSRLFEFEAATA